MSLRRWLLGSGALLVVGGVAAGLWLRRGLPARVPGPCETRRETQLHSRVETYDGFLDSERIIHHYDAQGRPVLDELLLEGKVHESTRWEHDAAGNTSLEERRTEGPIFHTDVDGTKRTLDFRLTRLRFTYDDQGRKLSRALERDGDGVVQHLTRYEYDDQGRLLRSQAHWDERYDSTTRYEYDDQGRLTAEISDGGAEAIKRYEYDERGDLVRETEDFMADGSIDTTAERRYDEQGRLVHEVLQGVNVGHRTIDWTLDEHGNVLLRREIQADEGGEVEIVETHGFRCWSFEDGQPVDQRNPA